MTDQTKTILIVLIIVLGWLLILAAVPSFAFYWRVDNEPGAAKMPELLWATFCFITSGGLLFLVGNIYFIFHRSKAIFVVWGICLVVGIGACSLLPILLLFMV